MNHIHDDMQEITKKAIEQNTYVCGADGKLCGLPREALPFPCQKCERNTNWKVEEEHKK